MLLAIAAVGLTIAFWMLVLSPQRKAVADAQSQVQTAQTALTAAQQKAQDGRSAASDYRRDRATIVKIGRVVPATDDIPTLLTQLQALAKKEHVWFTTYSVDGGGAGAASSATTSTTTPTTGSSNGSTAAVAPLYPPGSVQMSGGLGRTPIQIGLKGQYFNLERYLRAVQRFAVLSQNGERTNGRLLVIDGFEYTPGDRVAWISDKVEKLGQSIFLQAKLAASVYFAPPLDTPSTSNTGTAPGAAGATPSGTSTSTGAAAIGGIQ